MAKKNRKSAPKLSGGGAVCELVNLLRYEVAGLDLISSQHLPRASTPTDVDSTFTTKGKATIKRLRDRIQNIFSTEVCQWCICNFYQFDEQ